MDNELVRSMQKSLVSTDKTSGEKAGKALALTGVGGLGVLAVASIIPFFSILMLIAIVAGGYFWLFK